MSESEDSLQKAKEYQKKQQILHLVHLALSPAVMGLAVLTPLSIFLKNQALGLAGNFYAAAALYFAFFSLYLLIFDGPFAFYAGYALEKKYGLSNHTFGSWLLDFLKKSLLSFVFSLALVEGLYAIIRHFPGRWWLVAWAAFALVSYGMGKLFPVLVVPIFYKYKTLDREKLNQRICGLAARFGLPVENVYSLNLSRTTKKANAAFMGLGKTKRVVLSDTLLENFTDDEIETVVAHELGHFKHRDIWKQLGFGMVTSFLAFWISFHALDSAARKLGMQGASDMAALPLLFLIFFGIYLALMPVQNGFSRIVERAADRFALKAFPCPEIFVSCMEKLGRVNLADPDPHPLVEWFFYDHPAIGKRIRMAREWKT